MKFIPYIKVVLLILSALLFVVGVAGFDSDNPMVVNVGLDLLFLFSALLLILTAIAAVAMPIVNIAQNPKSALSAGIGVGVLALVFIISYAFAGTDIIALPNGDVFNDPATLKFADTALFATYIFSGGAILSIVGTEIYKALK